MDIPHKDDEPVESASAFPAAKGQRVAGMTGMSYKFQRLREKLRAAVASGELTGKLPGERALARRFHVNAKTLSKALTDLAAEGVLDRSIGRGTYVKGSEPAAPSQGRWLVLADEDQVESALVRALRLSNPELQVGTSVVEMRPSFLNQFAAVIDTASNTPESFLRDMVVRNMPVVLVNREPRTYSMHAVLMDVPLGVSRLGRNLLLSGHRRIAAVEPPDSVALFTTLRQTIARLDADASVDACTIADIQPLLDSGVTGIICGSCDVATQVKAYLEKSGAQLPAQVSLVAVGCAPQPAPCSGYFCSAEQLAEAAIGLLRNAIGTRPATLWLAGTWHDQGTIGPTPAIPVTESSHLRIEGLAG